jgi:hypothetical protein
VQVIQASHQACRFICITLIIPPHQANIGYYINIRCPKAIKGAARRLRRSHEQDFLCFGQHGVV